jgi:hypothetical protein
MATYVNDLRLKEISTGDESGTWGTSTNTNLELIGEALGYATQQVFGSDADATTTIADGASDPARAMYFKITSAGSLTATRTCTIAPNTVSRVMFIENATSGSQSIAISQGSGASVTILTGKTAVVYLDGAGATAAVVDAMSGVDPGVTDTLAEVLAAGNTSGGTNIELSTTDKVQFRDAAIYLNSSVDGQLDIVADTEIQIAATTVDLNGNLDVSGTTVSAGKITADAGIDIDNINIDGTTIALSSGDLTLDVAGDIILDADTGVWRFKDAGTTLYQIAVDGASVVLYTGVSDADMVFKGNDGGSTVTALTLDMSEAGAATFNAGVTAGALLLTSFAEIRSDTATLYLENAANTRYYSTKLSGANPDLVTSYYDGTSVTERMRIDSSGNLGLGVTPSAWNSGYKAMQLLTGALYGTSSRDTNLGANVFVNAGGGYAYIQSSFATNYTQFNGVHSWYTAPSGTAGDAISFTQAMTLDASGNLYLGATSGARGSASTRQLTKLGTGQAYLEIQSASTSSTDDGILFSDGSGGNYGLVGYNHNSDALNFFTASAEHMRINSSGNLLVGCTAVPSTSIEGFCATGTSSGNLSSSGASTSAYNHWLFVNGNGAVGSISTSSSATTYSTSSDQRLKENIADADDAGSKVDAIQVRKYDWIGDGSHQDYGLVAQELQPIAPLAVSGDANSEEMMGVDYSKLVPMMLKEIQSLRARVAQLES